MARSKTDVTKNIRKKIVGSSSMDYSGEVGQNLQLSKTLHGVSSYIETLSTNQQDLFKKLIAAVQEIPKNNAELQKQQKNVFDNLIKTTALLKKAAENEKDPEKKIPSTAAKAIKRSWKLPLSIQRKAQSAFFLTQSIVSIALKRCFFSAVSLI